MRTKVPGSCELQMKVLPAVPQAVCRKPGHGSILIPVPEAQCEKSSPCAGRHLVSEFWPTPGDDFCPRASSPCNCGSLHDDGSPLLTMPTLYTYVDDLAWPVRYKQYIDLLSFLYLHLAQRFLQCTNCNVAEWGFDHRHVFKSLADVHSAIWVSSASARTRCKKRQL